MKKNYFPCRRFYWASWRHKEGPQGLDQANTKLDREFGPKQSQIMRKTQSQGAVWKTINCKWFSANCKYRLQIGCFGPPIDGLKWTKIQQKSTKMVVKTLEDHGGICFIRRWAIWVPHHSKHMKMSGTPSQLRIAGFDLYFCLFNHFFQC